MSSTLPAAGRPLTSPPSWKKTVVVDDRLTTSLYDNCFDVIVHETAGGHATDKRAWTADPSPAVCYVIVSATSILWTALTLVASVLVSAALLTPRWLIGAAGGGVAVPAAASGRVLNASGTWSLSASAAERCPSASIGLLNECPPRLDCASMSLAEATFGGDDCYTYVTGFDMPDALFPDAWKSGLVLLTGAAVLLTFTAFASLTSFCVQSMFGKSIFTVSGLIQSIAALLLVVGQLLYTVGWTSRRIKDLCGFYAGPFVLDQCQLGPSFYGCMAGTALVFACALLSIRAESATSTDQVEKLIGDGRTVVCVR